jgi:hypothetical protein
MSDKPVRLTTYRDQNFALRQAVKEAADRAAEDIFEWGPGKTATHYEAMYEGDTWFGLELKHPEEIEPS